MTNFSFANKYYNSKGGISRNYCQETNKVNQKKDNLTVYIVNRYILPHK